MLFAEEEDSSADSESDQDSVLEEDVFLVEDVVGRRHRGKQVMYEIKWRGYTSSYNSWEPEHNLSAAALRYVCSKIFSPGGSLNHHFICIHDKCAPWHLMMYFHFQLTVPMIVQNVE